MNWIDIVILVIIGLLVLGALAYIIWQKKTDKGGGCGCGCNGCTGCSSAGSCETARRAAEEGKTDEDNHSSPLEE